MHLNSAAAGTVAWSLTDDAIRLRCSRRRRRTRCERWSWIQAQRLVVRDVEAVSRLDRRPKRVTRPCVKCGVPLATVVSCSWRCRDRAALLSPLPPTLATTLTPKKRRIRGPGGLRSHDLWAVVYRGRSDGEEALERRNPGCGIGSMSRVSSSLEARCTRPTGRVSRRPTFSDSTS